MPPRYQARVRLSSVVGVLVVSALSSVANGQPAAAPPPPAPPAPPPPPAAMPAPSPPEASAAPVLDPNQPLAGVSDGAMFLRSPDNDFVFFPNGRLQVDSYFFSSDNKTP